MIEAGPARTKSKVSIPSIGAAHGNVQRGRTRGAGVGLVVLATRAILRKPVKADSFGLSSIAKWVPGLCAFTASI